MPLLISPSNGSTNIFTTTLLDWSDANATSYRVQVSTDSLFGSTVVDQLNVISSQYRIDTLVLDYNTKYFWRVNGTNNFGTGPWSLVSNFRTITQLPIAPVLSSPLNGAINVSLTPLLDWVDVINANTYRAQIATDSNFTSIVFDQSGISQSQVTVAASILNFDTTYFWKSPDKIHLARGYGHQSGNSVLLIFFRRRLHCYPR
ncbi:MAG: hypothetical protein IPG99_08580 [Ignavibacteria bacterium]|nr:hypothetical protein [Ignavibacteria bacterium]